jgi:predicted DNA-binding transcriptional regulator YafY
MNRFSNDYLRQSEILAKCLNKEEFSKADYADMYKVTEITINRDLKFLRDQGIQIFSRKNKVMLMEPLAYDKLLEICSDYLPLKLSSDVFEKQIDTFLRTNAAKSSSLLINLTKAVKEKIVIKFKYQRLKDNVSDFYTIKPVKLMTEDLNWVLYGIKKDEDIVKKFYLTRITSLKLIDKKFQVIDFDKQSDEVYNMLFRFSPEVGEEINSKLWFEEFEINEDSAGFFILKTKQPITNKLTSWCISWWDKLEIIEPFELKENIKLMIDSFANKNNL